MITINLYLSFEVEASLRSLDHAKRGYRFHARAWLYCEFNSRVDLPPGAGLILQVTKSHS
jgi:hypothetical protein